jgi:hypothetical protein
MRRVCKKQDNRSLIWLEKLLHLGFPEHDSSKGETAESILRHKDVLFCEF